MSISLRPWWTWTWPALAFAIMIMTMIFGAAGATAAAAGVVLIAAVFAAVYHAEGGGAPDRRTVRHVAVVMIVCNGKEMVWPCPSTCPSRNTGIDFLAAAASGSV